MPALPPSQREEQKEYTNTNLTEDEISASEEMFDDFEAEEDAPESSRSSDPEETDGEEAEELELDDISEENSEDSKGVDSKGVDSKGVDSKEVDSKGVDSKGPSSEQSDTLGFGTPIAILDGTPTGEAERARLREIIDQRRDVHLGHQKSWGVLIAVASVLALILWGLSFYAGNIDFVEGLFSGLIFVGVAAFYAWRLKQELVEIHLLELDQRDKRKRLIKGKIQRKESTHNSDGVHYFFTLDGQSYELPRERFQEVRIDEPLRLHLALHSGALLRIESLRKKKKRKKKKQKKKKQEKKKQEKISKKRSAKN